MLPPFGGREGTEGVPPPPVRASGLLEGASKSWSRFYRREPDSDDESKAEGAQAEDSADAGSPSEGKAVVIATPRHTAPRHATPHHATPSQAKPSQATVRCAHACRRQRRLQTKERARRQQATRPRLPAGPSHGPMGGGSGRCRPGRCCMPWQSWCCAWRTRSSAPRLPMRLASPRWVVAVLRVWGEGASPPDAMSPPPCLHSVRLGGGA
jgi:hypothetical protein